MKLTVRDLARVFDAPEATIERWIHDDGLPHHQAHGQKRFHRAEVLEWANLHGVRIARDPQVQERGTGSASRLCDALGVGGVHYAVRGGDRESMLRAVIAQLPLPDDVDREMVFDVLVARENMGSTGIGGGIAIPHVRNPLVLPVDAPIVALCFLAAPVEFNAIDQKPVDTVFAIVAPTTRLHLSVLARLAALLHDSDFVAAMKVRAPAAQLLALAHGAEQRFVGAPTDGARTPDGSEEEDDDGEAVTP